jgi:hypothetical protein
MAALLLATALIGTLASARASALGLGGYPTQAEAYLVSHGLLDPSHHRIAAQDIVGCYLILIRGTTGRVFVDDRVDMYPVSVSQAYDDLLHGTANSVSVLDRYGVDVVLWNRRLPLVDELRVHGGWRQVYPADTAPSRGPGSDQRWTVFVRDASVPATPPT